MPPLSAPPGPSTGTDWLRNLQMASGGHDFATNNNSFGGAGSEEEDGEADGSGGNDTPGSNGATAAKSGRSKGGSGGRPSQKRRQTSGSGAGDAQDNGGEDGGASPQEDRKTLNRLAQREFRQRKQQYIRALETRVELLSSDHDTQVDRLRHALRGLLAENNMLRTMLGSFAGFIGQGALGGPLQQNGISREGLIELIEGRSEKTMTDLWQNWPGAKECEALRQLREEAHIPVEGLPELQEQRSTGKSSKAAPATTAPTTQTQIQHQDTSQAHGSQTLGINPARPLPSPAMPSQIDPAAFANLSAGNFFPQAVGQTPSASFFGSGSSGNGLNPYSFNAGDEADSALMASLFGMDTMGGGNAGIAQMTSLDTHLTMPPADNHSSHNLAPQQFTKQRPSIQLPPEEAKMVKYGRLFVQSLRQVDGSSSSMDRISTLADKLNTLMASLFSNSESQGNCRLSQTGHALLPQPSAAGPPITEEDVQRKLTAFIQLAYHVSNFRRNTSYQLPGTLRPTDLQINRPHDPLIDGIPFANLRDALIVADEQGKLQQVAAEAPTIVCQSHSGSGSGTPAAGGGHGTGTPSSPPSPPPSSVQIKGIDEVIFHLLCSARLKEAGDVMSEDTWLVDDAFAVRFPFLATRDIVAAVQRWKQVFGVVGAGAAGAETTTTTTAAAAATGRGRTS